MSVPDFAGPQHAAVRQIRQFFDIDAPFWHGQPLAGAALEAVDRQPCLLPPTVSPTELTRHAARQKVHFLVCWFAY